jgi:NADH-quinone oxidoreductase subunit H
LGAFRAVAQLISYEIPMLMSLVVPVMLAGSMGMNDLVRAQTVPFIIMAPVSALIYFITSLAENSRAPFDLMEADSELVAGINTEYSGLKFGMFYVGDFLHAFTLALVFTTIFMGGWAGPGAETYPVLGFLYFAMKTAIVYMFGLLVRFSLPRFRIDQMMSINWKLLTPLALVNLMVMAVAIKAVAELPLLVQVIALFGINAVILVAAAQILDRVEKRRKKARYTAAPRPIAMADRVSDQS